jgi:hypothetical protein
LSSPIVLGLLGGNLFLACSGRDSAEGTAAPPASIGSTQPSPYASATPNAMPDASVDGDAHAQHDAPSTPSDSSSDAGDSSTTDAATCSALAYVAATTNFYFVDHATATPAGGAILDGLYRLTEETNYGANGPPGVSGGTTWLRIQGPVWDVAWYGGADDKHQRVGVAAAGVSLSFNSVCTDHPFDEYFSDSAVVSYTSSTVAGEMDLVLYVYNGALIAGALKFVHQ